MENLLELLHVRNLKDGAHDGGHGEAEPTTVQRVRHDLGVIEGGDCFHGMERGDPSTKVTVRAKEKQERQGKKEQASKEKRARARKTYRPARTSSGSSAAP